MEQRFITSYRDEINMKRRQLSLFQILNPRHKFNLTLYTDKGIITFNSLSIEQIASFLYPYFRKYHIMGEFDGNEATLVFSKGTKRMYASIEIVD